MRVKEIVSCENKQRKFDFETADDGTLQLTLDGLLSPVGTKPKTFVFDNTLVRRGWALKKTRSEAATKSKSKWQPKTGLPTREQEFVWWSKVKKKVCTDTLTVHRIRKFGAGSVNQRWKKAPLR